MIFQNKIKKVIVFISLISFCVVGAACGKKESQIPFNSDEWKKMEKIERYRMVDDLISQSSLIGKSNTEVVELLGPDSGKYDSDKDWNDENYYLKYTIRYDDMEGYEVLLVQFRDNKVVNVEKEYLEYL